MSIGISEERRTRRWERNKVGSFSGEGLNSTSDWKLWESGYRRDLTMLAVNNLWAQLLFVGREGIAVLVEPCLMPDSMILLSSEVRWVMLLLVSMIAFLSQGIVRDPNYTGSVRLISIENELDSHVRLTSS